MNALITGGAGFIGSNLVELLLKKDFNVTIIDNLSTGYLKNINPEKVDFFEGDVRDSELVNKLAKNKDVIFHLAASIGNSKSIAHPQQDSEINVIGTVNVLEAARNNRVNRVVYSSSAAIFGELLTMPIDETHPQNPDSPYGVSKLAAEKHLLCWGKLYDITVIALRYFNVYGCRQRFDEYGNVIPIFAEKLYNKQNLTIYGDGEQTRDFVNVKDVALANYLAATQAKESTVYNIGSGKNITINYLAEVMKRLFESNIESNFTLPRKGEVLHCRADILKITKDLGFQPNDDIELGLKEYVTWFKNDKSG